MTKPAQNLSDCFDRVPRGNERPADHHHRQRKIARRFDLGRGRASAGIPGHDNVGSEILKHGPIAGTLEWPARDNDLRIRQRQRIARRIDQPHQIDVLRGRGESSQMLPTDAQEYPARLASESFRGSHDIIDFDPAIARLAPPRRSFQREQRHADDLAGLDGIRAHLRCEWMGRIDDAIDILRTKIVNKASGATEAADAPANRRWQRILGTAGVGQHRVDIRVIRQGGREPVRIGGATQDQNTQSSGSRGCHDPQQ